MQNTRKIISLLLCFFCLATFFPVFAEPNNDNINSSNDTNSTIDVNNSNATAYNLNSDNRPNNLVENPEDENARLISPIDANNVTPASYDEDYSTLDSFLIETDKEEEEEEKEGDTPEVFPWSENYYAPLQRIENTAAEFYGLDKISGNVQIFTVPIGYTYQFGSLKVTPKICYTSGANEPDFTTAFVEVRSVNLDMKINSLFSGWMFANSPGLNAVEHAVYDVWLKQCKMVSESSLIENDNINLIEEIEF